MDKTSVTESSIGYTYSYHWETGYQARSGNFLRIGLQQSLVSGNKISVSMPVSATYSLRKNVRNMVGYEYGCFTGFSGRRQISADNQAAGMSLGVRFDFFEKSKRLNFFTGLSMQGEVIVRQQTHIIETDDRGTREYTYDGAFPAGTFLYSSLDNGLMYRFSPEASVGLVTSLYFLRLNGIIRYFGNAAPFNLGYGPRSAIVNTGLRAELRF